MRKEEADDYSDKLRKLKNDVFNQGEKLDQVKRVKETKLRERENYEQELLRV